MAKNTNIKFGVRAPRESPYSTWILEEIFFETSVWPESRDLSHFWAINANSSKMATDTDFKYGMHAQGNVPTWPLK